MNFNFIASDDFNLNDFRDIEKFVDSYPDFQTVTLKDPDELKLLLRLAGINTLKDYDLDSPYFIKYWDLSDFKLPEFNNEQFDQFYENWIHKSGRDNNMDEYGNLIFLQGLSLKWNQLNYRLVIQEK